MKKINIMILANLGFAALFSLFNICFHADISCLAFVISMIFTGLMFKFLGLDVYKKQLSEKVFCAKKFLQYEPYVFLIAFIMRRAGSKGTSFAFDLVSVIFWLGVFVTSLILQHYFKPSKYKAMTDIVIKDFKNEDVFKMYAKGKNRDGKKVTGIDYLKWLGFEIVDWGDALIQAVFMVLLFQIFLFQFYMIPSESMVPEYMIGDRVAVTKITSGPKFPLSDVGIPCIKEYHRGDIVVFRNPHYTINRESEVKTVVSQIIYMLTFTLVNTNVDENGKLKADPLVKRITGVAGEQLMMQDGILYARTKDSPDFKPVEEDKKWAVYNLNEENPQLKRLIHDFPVTDEDFNGLCFVEEQRNSLDIENAKQKCKELSNRFSKLCRNSSASEADVISLFNSSEMQVKYVFNFYYNYVQRVLSVDGGKQWFTGFMTDWIDQYDSLLSNGMVGGDLYQDSCYKINVMFKMTLGELFVRIAELSKDQVPTESWQNDEVLMQNHMLLIYLHNYMCAMDRRNMPVFPPNDENGNPQYIPDGHYFMMGDNRFNSLDMRHTDKEYLTTITPYDAYSLTYYTSMKPQYVPKKLILGSTGIRFWPLARPVRKAR